MSQVFNGQTGGGGGLTSVATDATLNGDGTALDPLSVADPFVPYAPSVMTAQLPATGIMLTSPFTSYPMMGGAYIQEISSLDFDITASAIRPLFDGQMKVTVQYTLMSMPVGSDASVQFTVGLCDALLPAPVGLFQSSDTCYIDNGLDALQSVRCTYIIECVSGQLYHPYLVSTGDVVDWELLGDEGRTTIVAERIA